ncbi:MAG TPA: aconitate hydratase [Kofleriaceae bacterium]|nr:aconitate hydratase [Kofleriaceae bacterium]
MGLNVAQKLIASHLVSGDMVPGREIGLHIDQTLTQDATGTLVMLELEAMGLERVRTELSAQYVDHNLIQADFKNPDDHLFLKSACDRFGIFFSRPGNGVSHPLHMERFGIPGKSLLGSDSHTCAAGSLGMLAIGAGGMDVAMAMAGEPFYVKMPRVFGVHLHGELPDWVSAKDVILEMLRRHGVSGGRGAIIEYFGPGLAHLSAMDRHVIANMGAELGATTTVFPSDDAVRAHLAEQRREADFLALSADPDADYDQADDIDLGTLEPLIAMPSSPGNVVPVREVAGQHIYQAYVGSSANPGFRDFAIAAAMVDGHRIAPNVSFDVTPTSRQILENLIAGGQLGALVRAGARVHQAGCGGCIGMGQAPATGQLSLRTVPRNFPGRSGTRDDQVCLVSPETATASALTGKITDPRTLGRPYPQVADPAHPILNREMMLAPVTGGPRAELVFGPNIVALPDLDPLPEHLEVPVLLKVGDDVSTDEIMPAGERVLPLRSNIPAIARHTFEMIDESYPERALKVRGRGGHAVVGGDNYGQGSSREHAALAPRYLGLRAVIAKSFARIHAQNLANFGILPLSFVDPADADDIEAGDDLVVVKPRESIARGADLAIRSKTRSRTMFVRPELSQRQIEIVLAGGVINWIRARL